ncbi:MAG: nuclease-related domain-containing protein [Vicinamibacterales bacterium]|nr:nuclease-related domain-containing protein [Vicinamibacterales bacterium]
MKPTNTLLIGSPLSGYEARFLRRLYADIEPTGALILANFHAGSRQIDFVVVTDSMAAIIELKHLSEPIFGQQNGRWMIGDRSGKRRPYPGPNPWQQTLEQKYALSDEMRQYEARRGGTSSPRFFAEFDAYVCIVPQLHPRSDVFRGDNKVGVRSYVDVIGALRSGAKTASWSRGDWLQFATGHLSLAPATLDQATDPNVLAATDVVRAYESRVECVLGFQLPPLLPAAEERCVGQTLVDSVLAGDNHLLVGPSGSAKTFHLHHVAVAAARQGAEVPVLVEPRTYRGGDFWSLVRRGIAPMHSADARAFLDAVRLCGLRPVLLVDALNECPAEHVGELLRGVQAFALHFDARVVLASQDELALPDDLTPRITHLTTPAGEDKRQIYRHHAGVASMPDADYFCEAFTNAYELTVAGRCHGTGVPASTRTELFDRYVQARLSEHYHVGAALLRAIATEMAKTVSSSWERSEYERFAERLLAERGGSLATLDYLRRCGLIRLNDGFFSFEHELLADHFNATEIYRRHDRSSDLTAELRKPRNQRLIELVLPRLIDDATTSDVLSVVVDRALLSRVIEGRCGLRPQAVLLANIDALFKQAVRDLPSITCKCHIADLDDGRRLLTMVSLEGHRIWSRYGVRLCELIAHHLDIPAVASGLLELVHLTEWALRRAAGDAAEREGIKPRRVWEEILRWHGGSVRSSGPELPCTVMLAELRSAMTARSYPGGTPIRKALLELATTEPSGHFALLSLLRERRTADDDDLDTILDLVRRGWESEIYHLRLDALTFLQSLRHEFSASAISRICGVLRGFDTKNILINTVLFETLARYGGLEPPVTAEAALAEMHSAIAPDALDDPALGDVARALGVEPREVLAGHAYGCLSRIFEDIFQGAYCEAYDALSREEKSAILSLAATSSDCGFHSSWVLSELLEHGGREALPVYLRYASAIDGHSQCAQDTSAAFLLALEGCAQFMDTPPPYVGGDAPPHRAWRIAGEVVFWTHRQSSTARKSWSQFEGPTRLAAADVLHNVIGCRWQLGERPSSLDLVSMYSEEIRPIVEDCLRGRDLLPTVFAYGGCRAPAVILNLITMLGRIGDEGSARLLHTLIDDDQLGPAAMEAIEAIRKPIRQAQ